MKSWCGGFSKRLSCISPGPKQGISVQGCQRIITSPAVINKDVVKSIALQQL